MSSSARISSRILDKIKECCERDQVMKDFLKKLLFEDPGASAWWKKLYEELIKDYAVKWQGDRK